MNALQIIACIAIGVLIVVLASRVALWHALRRHLLKPHRNHVHIATQPFSSAGVRDEVLEQDWGYGPSSGIHPSAGQYFK